MFVFVCCLFVSIIICLELLGIFLPMFTSLLCEVGMVGESAASVIGIDYAYSYHEAHLSFFYLCFLSFFFYCCRCL